jgi:hypothetical protein
MTEFREALHSWQNFYFMAGGAAATLLGLMFVALSLGTHLIGETTKNNIEIFVTPSIIYFVSVLLMACVMLVPAHSTGTLAIALVVGGILGVILIFPTIKRLLAAARRHQDFDLMDWLAQIILPLLSYILIAVGGILTFANQWAITFAEMWLVAIFLLISAIANTWSLVLWIVDQRPLQ